ncbi:MAG TPA: hypothetical protein V6D05_03825 [Stenomitos sp.]
MSRIASRLLLSLLLPALLAGCQLITDDAQGSLSKASPAPTNVLTGLVLAPASLVSNNTSASIISNNSANYRVAAVRELPVVQAQVTLERPDGSAAARTTTDQTGRYSFAGVELGKAYLVQTSFTVEHQTYRELALAKPSTSSTEAPVTSASTLVGAKIVSTIGQSAIGRIEIGKVQQLVEKVSSAQTDAVPPALDSLDSSAKAMDELTSTDPTLIQDLGDAMGESFGGTVK